jgi:hypothetical protein
MRLGGNKNRKTHKPQGRRGTQSFAETKLTVANKLKKRLTLPHAVPSIVGEALGVGEGFEGAQHLQVAVEQHAGAGVVGE